MKKENNKNRLIGIGILAYFFSTIIAIIYFAQINSPIAALLFGQLFFTFGIFILTSKEIIGLIFVLVGLAIFMVSSYYLWGTHLNIDIELIIKVLFALGFISIPIIWSLSEKISKSRALRVCTYKIIGKCIAHEESYGKKNKMYAPIYEFEFEGKKHVVTEPRASNIAVCKIGSERELFINPNNPKEYYFFETKVFTYAKIVFFSISVIAGLLVLYLVLFT